MCDHTILIIWDKGYILRIFSYDFGFMWFLFSFFTCIINKFSKYLSKKKEKNILHMLIMIGAGKWSMGL